MAKVESIKYVDDLDGSEAVGPVRFGLDKGRYVIDLSEENSARLREFLAPYIAAARIDRDAKPGKPRAGQGDKEELAAIREWAREQGFPVKDRGRIPETVLAVYRARYAA